MGWMGNGQPMKHAAVEWREIQTFEPRANSHSASHPAVGASMDDLQHTVLSSVARKLDFGVLDENARVPAAPPRSVSVLRRPLLPDSPPAVPSVPTRPPLQHVNPNVQQAAVVSKEKDGKPFIPAPQWVPNGQSALCSRCQEPFSWLLRRHHCRLCGNLFCSDCTPYSTPIPAFGWKNPVRVCVACIDNYVRTVVQPPTAAAAQDDRYRDFADVQRVLFTDAREVVQPSTGLWVPDALVSRCMKCRSQFGFWLRKHHCRGCGKVRQMQTL